MTVCRDFSFLGVRECADERAARGFARRAGCSGGACMAAGFTARHGGILSGGLAACFGVEMRRAFVDERVVRGLLGGRGCARTRRAHCSGGVCMAAGFTARHGVICPAGLRPAFEWECAGLSWMDARRAVLPGVRAASGGACRAVGFPARHGVICPAGLRKSEICRAFIVNSDCICVVVML